MPGSRNIVVLGSINMDLFVEAPRFPRPGETLAGTHFSLGGGGKGANQAVASARLAGPGVVELVGKIGGDSFGTELLHGLESSGVGCSGIHRSSSSMTGVALVYQDAAHQNFVVPVLGANGDCGDHEVAATLALLGEGGILIMQQEIPPEVSVSAARLARSKGVTVIVDPAPAVDADIACELISLADIITPNQIEAEAISGIPARDVSSAGLAADRIRDLGCPAVIVTLGSLGCYVSSETLTGHYAAPEVDVRASVAAGDAYVGALAVGLLEGSELSDAIIFANRGAALSVSRFGAQDSMPWRAELDSWAFDA